MPTPLAKAGMPLSAGVLGLPLAFGNKCCCKCFRQFEPWGERIPGITGDPYPTPEEYDPLTYYQQGALVISNSSITAVPNQTIPVFLTSSGYSFWDPPLLPGVGSLVWEHWDVLTGDITGIDPTADYPIRWDWGAITYLGCNVLTNPDSPFSWLPDSLTGCGYPIQGITPKAFGIFGWRLRGSNGEISRCGITKHLDACVTECEDFNPCYFTVSSWNPIVANVTGIRFYNFENNYFPDLTYDNGNCTYPPDYNSPNYIPGTCDMTLYEVHP